MSVLKQFKNENAFKRWHCKYFFRGYICFYTEVRNCAGFPDVLLSPKNKSFGVKNVFCEYKYLQTYFDPFKNYKIDYRPLQQSTLLQLSENGNSPAFVVIGFHDVFILANNAPDSIGKDSESNIAIFTYTDFASLQENLDNTHLHEIGLC